MKSPKFIRTACLLFLSQISTLAIAADFQIVTAYPLDNFHEQNLVRFAQEISTETQGQVSLHIKPNASAYPMPDILPAVSAGKAEGGEVILSALSKDSPLFALDSIPFVVNGYDDAQNLWNLSRAAVEAELKKHGVELLYAVAWPPQNLYSNRPIATARDLKGLRFRTYNPGTTRLAELVDAVPATIQVVDLKSAIANDKLDVMLTSSWTGVDCEAWSRLHYYYTVNAWIPKNIVFVNSAWFAKLTAEQQQIVRAAAKRAEERGWKTSREKAAGFDAVLAQNKISMQTPSAFLEDDFHRYGETLSREWLKAAGAPGLDIMLRYELAKFHTSDQAPSAATVSQLTASMRNDR